LIEQLEKQGEQKDILEDAILDSNEDGLIAETISYNKEKQGEKIDVIETFDTEFEKQVSHLIASAINKEYEYNQGYVKWTANALLNYAKHEIEWQGEKKPADNVEPKFKNGQWIVFNGLTLYVNEVVQGYYRTISINGIPNSYDWDIDNLARLWTIADAKDGDVLSDETTIFIFKDLLSDGSVMSYCDYDTDSGESDAFCPLSVNLLCSKIIPATKEQRDFLFSKMKEAGYKWDSEKKELKKIEQNPAEWHREDEQNLNACLGYIPDEFLRRWLTNIIHVKYDRNY
jgi:hypothetical protein